MNRPNRWATAARTALAIQMFDAGAPIRTIKTALGQLPGHDMLRVTFLAIQQHIAEHTHIRSEASQAPIDVRYRDVLMHVGPEFETPHIGRVWPDKLIAAVNQWRDDRNLALVRVTGP